MKKILLSTCFLLMSISIFAQVAGRRTSPLRNRIPQSQQEPTEGQIAERERKIEERKQEFLNNFLTTLEADDFQKEIIKQTLEDYFEKKIALYKVQYSVREERADAVKNLDSMHFKELKSLISKGDMKKINDMISGGFDEGEVKKKKKKAKKKRKKKKKDTDDSSEG